MLQWKMSELPLKSFYFWTDLVGRGDRMLCSEWIFDKLRNCSANDMNERILLVTVQENIRISLIFLWRAQNLEVWYLSLPFKTIVLKRYFRSPTWRWRPGLRRCGLRWSGGRRGRHPGWTSPYHYHHYHYLMELQ